MDMSQRHHHSHTHGYRSARRVVAVLACVFALCAGGGAGRRRREARPPGGYSRTNLVSDVPGKAQVLDSNLVNAWGMASGPTTPVWVSAADSGVSTIYRGAAGATPVSIVPLVVTIRVAARPDRCSTPPPASRSPRVSRRCSSSPPSPGTSRPGTCRRGRRRRRWPARPTLSTRAWRWPRRRAVRTSTPRTSTPARSTCSTRRSR